MRKMQLASLALISLSGLVSMASCSSSSNPTTPAADAGMDGTAGGNFALTVPCTDSVASLYADPGTLPTAAGTIIRCHQDADISMTDLQAAASASDDAGAAGYSGKPFTSGAHVYRILYRTERGNAAKTPGYSVALVYVPLVPRAPMLPTVLAAHGSRGQAAHCAPSLADPAASDVEGDFIHQVYPLIGGGLFVVAPDLAGYANYGGASNPPSGYGVAADGAKSMLDGARAAQKMFVGSLTSNVVITGHSIGGQTALATFALWSGPNGYAPELDVKAVAVYAPAWLPGRSYGAILLDPHGYPISTSAPPQPTLWYFYTKGALELGVDHALDVFASDPAKRAAVKSFVDNDCWNESYPDLAANFMSANDALDPTFVSNIGPAAGPMDSMCAGAPDGTCLQWMGYFNSERPHLPTQAKAVPLLYLIGGMDTTITPDLSTCGHDRLVADGANMTVCFEPAVDHSGIVATKADYVNDWIAAQTLSGAMPAACTSGWPTAPDGGTPDAGPFKYICNGLVVNTED